VVPCKDKLGERNSPHTHFFLYIGTIYTGLVVIIGESLVVEIDKGNWWLKINDLTQKGYQMVPMRFYIILYPIDTQSTFMFDKLSKESFHIVRSRVDYIGKI